jgi:repressor LexA
VEGRAAAGPPITAVPEDERRILVPVKYTGEQFFIVQAEGDSMTGVIGDGDYGVFNKRGSFDNGRIALVQVDGPTDQPDATIKRVYRRPGGKVELRSENPKYPPMFYPAEEVVLMGELVAVLPRDTAMQ